MQYLMIDVVEGDYTVVDILNQCEADDWYLNLSSWDGNFDCNKGMDEDPTQDCYDSIERWMGDTNEIDITTSIVCQHENLTPEVLKKEFPELFI